MVPEYTEPIKSKFWKTAAKNEKQSSWRNIFKDTERKPGKSPYTCLCAVNLCC